MMCTCKCMPHKTPSIGPDANPSVLSNYEHADSGGVELCLGGVRAAGDWSLGPVTFVNSLSVVD